MFNKEAILKMLERKQGSTAQCVFLESESFEEADKAKPHYIDGILKDDEIICLCCGAIFSVEEILQDAEDAGYDFPPLIIFEDWESLNGSICGWDGTEEAWAYAKSVGLM